MIHDSFFSTYSTSKLHCSKRVRGTTKLSIACVGVCWGLECLKTKAALVGGGRWRFRLMPSSRATFTPLQTWQPPPPPPPPRSTFSKLFFCANRFHSNPLFFREFCAVMARHETSSNFRSRNRTNQDYRLVQKKGTVLLSTSLAWPAVAGCSRAETFSQLSAISFAQPCSMPELTELNRWDFLYIIHW